MSTLRIRLFGSLDLERGGQPLERLPSRKARDLFAYLAVQRQSNHAREQLAGVFWGDSEEDKARQALNTTLWRIHRVLGETVGGARQNTYLRVTRQHIAFNMAADVWLDVAEFESRCMLAEHAAAPAERAALYEQALSFYRGDLLLDCYEDWCLIERERLQAVYLRALACLMAYYSKQAAHQQAIECGRRILGCDMLQEEVHRDLIRLYLELGQPAAALRQYRICEELLQQELGIEPAAETRHLLAHILGAGKETLVAHPPVARAAGTESQSDVEGMVAQLEELSSLCESLRVGLDRATTLMSRLAIQVDGFAALHEPPLSKTVPLRKVVG